jgi:hypothetical protein
MKMSALLSVVLTSFILSNVFAQDPSIEFTNGTVRAFNLNKEILYFFVRYNRDQEDWQEVFPIRTHGATINIAGTYEVGETDVKFTPRFPWAKGVKYEASFDLAQLAKNYNEVYIPPSRADVLKVEFSLTPSSKVIPKVIAVYPSSNVLPENQLKFHIAFNTPMTHGDVYNFVKILDSKGAEVERAFLIVDQEFWDPEMKVVTLLLDPGRIKRGLKANVQMGAPLKAQEHYQLVVKAGWKNIDGVHTASNYTKPFHCVDADRKQIDISTWKITVPAVSTDELIIDCSENLNYILASDGIRVTDEKNNPVEGDIVLREDESAIVFRPKARWSNGTYTVTVNPLLEDLAGNNLKRLFDEDMQAAPRTIMTTRTFTVNIPRN